jgi:CRP-like cAMP-binding protein
MTEMPDKAHTESLIAGLRKVPAFADLSQDDLEWFIGHAEERRATPGEAVTVEDSPAELMLVLLEGEIRGRREADGPDSQTYTVQGPAVSGYLPF